MNLYQPSLPSIKAANDKAFLTAEQANDLIRRYQATDCQVSLTKLVVSYSELCLNIAKRYWRQFEIEDTYQEAMINLLQAIRTYDVESTDYTFFSYASSLVFRKISQTNIFAWSMVSPPKTKAYLKAFRKVSKLGLGNTIPVGLAESLAKELSVPIADIFMAHALYRHTPVSIDAELETGASLLDLMEDTRGNPEAIVTKLDYEIKRKRQAERLLSCLNDREKIVLTKRRLEDEPLTLQEISLELGVSKERVRQIENNAMSKLQVAA